MDDQEQRNRSVVAEVADFLGGPQPDDDGWRFEFGEHLSSNWGAVFGGATAAAAVTLSRVAAPDRAPRSLHVQMVRPLPCGPATAGVTVRHSGRAVTTVETEIYDQRGKLAVLALVTAVQPGALASHHHDTAAQAFRTRAVPMPPADPAASVEAPIANALNMAAFGQRLDILNRPPSITGDPAMGLSITAPWADVAHTSPELACLIADAANGMPIFQAMGSAGVSWPNTDLTLRFTDAPGAPEILACGTLVSVQHGTTTVAIEVQAGEHQLAHGHSTSVLIPTHP